MLAVACEQGTIRENRYTNSVLDGEMGGGNIFFLIFLNQNIYCGYSKEPSH